MKDDDTIVFMNNLKQRRGELGLSRVEAATSLGITTDYYNKIERGFSVPSAKYNGSFERVFGVSYKELFPEFYELAQTS